MFFILIAETFILVGLSTFGLRPNVTVNIKQFSFQHTTTQHCHLQEAPVLCQPGGTQPSPSPHTFYFYFFKRPAGHSTVCAPSSAAGLSDHCCSTHKTSTQPAEERIALSSPGDFSETGTADQLWLTAGQGSGMQKCGILERLTNMVLMLLHKWASRCHTGRNPGQY